MNATERPPISKRAARRLIQQAFVLTGRDRILRQHIREARFATLWVLEDWGFEWTVSLDRGRLQFDRRPVHAPDVTLTWPNAAAFFANIQEGRAPDDSMAIEGNRQFRTQVDLLYRTFWRLLDQVMKEPVDDAGKPLM